jgi:APA family basic amino acid/polyamine antiporter
LEHLERRLGAFSATTLLVGSMIGSGIFVAPSIMAGYVATPGVWLSLWLVGGVLTLLGALAYAELAAMMPRAGGQYVYLREAFGRPVAFLYGWTLFLVIQSGTNAAVAIAFAKFLGALGVPVGEGDVLVSFAGLTLSRGQVVGAAVIALLTWVNARGVREGALVQNVFTVLKVGAIALLVVVGFASGSGSWSHFAPLTGRALGPQAMLHGIAFLPALGVAMSKALFAYDAWNTVTFAAGEVKAPERNLPRALVIGTAVTALVYILACALYLYVLPIDRMAGVAENRVASEVARVLLGRGGVVLVIVAILVSTFGCLNGLILGGARVLYAMARDGVFFAAAGRVDERRHVPTTALILQAVWSSVLALSGRYDELLTYVIFASLSFNALTVLGVFVLRRSRPEAPRPYRTWGYPVVPAAFLIGAVFFVVYIFVGDPKDSLKGVAIVALVGLGYRLVGARATAA